MTILTDRRDFLKLTSSILLAPAVLAQARELRCDVAVIGGGTGGFAAALAALRNGRRVVLTEETDWIGGQLTAQAVPPDEHPWIEQFGATRSYRAFRAAVRNYYREHYPLTEAARARADLNPGNGSVSRLCHEFRVSVAVLESMLIPYIGNGQLTILLEHVPESATVDRDRVTSIGVLDLRAGAKKFIVADYFIDATELGDVLPLTKTEFVTGAESQAQTGELHAPSTAQPQNSQSYTFCFAMDYLPEEDHTIEKPEQYAFWRDYIPKLTPPWTGPLLNWAACEPKTLSKRDLFFEPGEGAKLRSALNLWVYRRIADTSNFSPGAYRSSITLVNWPQNDFWLGDLVTATPNQAKQYLAQAKQLSVSLLYWMQTDAPRPDGGTGWKGLRLRRDIVGTADGLAKAVYV
ncbi:MAG: FAD-dependent oxidoreductase, partial [Acidobacteriaceae bacterium]|nr:FAD-dependent oxidoreductase [Acidobacteriaceae bacterium]